jgi:ABC-2 type transport system ATP-binding protein
LSHAIVASGLHKTFVKPRSIREIMLHPFGRARRIEALRGVDLDVREGEILGLLGPNGAGKTTLLKIFSCLVLPDTGQATVLGTPTEDENRVKRTIGLVSTDERSFYWRLSARENLRFFARLYDVPVRSTESRIDELLERVDLVEAADRPFSGYSSGMKQRVSIARALLHDPPILLMDEPTRSLDPASSIALRGFIDRELNRRDGKTIVLATHDLREAEAISHRVAILVSGRIRELGTVEKVRRWGVRDRLFRLELEQFEGAAPGSFRFVEDETVHGVRRLTVAMEDGSSLDELLRSLIGAGARVRMCDAVEPDLEQAFSRILDSEQVRS